MFSGCNFHGETNINIDQGKSGFHSDDDPENTYSTTIRNNDRYGSDTQKVWVIRTANQDGLSLVLEVKAERDGMLSYSDYWHYPSSDVQKRDASFDEIVKVANDVKRKIEQDHLPIPMIATLFKSATRYLDLPHKERSTVSNFNDSTLLDAEMDWRKSLYGNRYPQYEHPGSIQDSWLSRHVYNEQSQSMRTDGDSSRQRITKYKYE